jgi:hypothetical protein
MHQRKRHQIMFVHFLMKFYPIHLNMERIMSFQQNLLLIFLYELA